MSDYRTEFPDFQSEIPTVFLSAPWRDASWHNNATPSFARTLPSGREIHIFVDEADPDRRWDGDNCERFCVHATDANGAFDYDHPCFLSEDLDAILEHVEKLAAELSR